MTVLELLWHTLNFVAPAVGMGLMLAAALRWRHGCALVPSWWRLSAVGGVVLVAGLVLLERDGAMLTYATLVLAQATLAWWLARS